MSGAVLDLYYDGQCPFCAAEMERLARWDAEGRLAFIDIAASDFDAAAHGLVLEALDRELHGKTSAGETLVGVEAILAAYTLSGKAWLVWPLRAPVLRSLLAHLYRGFARRRYLFSRWLGYGRQSVCTDGRCALRR